MFVLIDSSFVSSVQRTNIIEKLKNPFNDTDYTFEVKSVEVGNYTIATNSCLYDASPNLKMVYNTKSKNLKMDELYEELCNYSDFGNNIENLKMFVKRYTKSNESFCIAAINNKGDYIIINDTIGLVQIYSGIVGNNNIIYSTYHINTYFKEFISVDKVTPISKDNVLLCINNTIQNIQMVDTNTEVSIAGQLGKGIMGGDLESSMMNSGLDSIFGPLVSNKTDQMSNIEYETRPNKYGVSIFDRIIQWTTVQREFFNRDNINKTISIPKSTNVFHDKHFFNNYKSSYYDTVVNVISEDWVDKGLEMKSRGLNPVILNMTDKTFPAVDIHLGIGGQEESIYRRSNLNEALILDKFYPFVIDNKVIYSTDVTIFCSSENKKWELFKNLEKMCFISCPPIKSPYNLQYDYTKVFENANMCDSHVIVTKGYLSNTFQVAIKNGHDSIVLPAFGCEGQKNPPRCIAKILKELIKQYHGYFKEIVVCIPESDDRLLGKYHIFKSTLETIEPAIKVIDQTDENNEVKLENILEKLE